MKARLLNTISVTLDFCELVEINNKYQNSLNFLAELFGVKH